MMKSRMPTQPTDTPPSVEALLREKDARIAELAADKAHLYHLLAETQASLAREQALRSSPERPPVAAPPEPFTELPITVTPFKFASDEGKAVMEAPPKAAEYPTPDAPEATAVMELFKFVSVEGEPTSPPTAQPAAMEAGPPPAISLQKPAPETPKKQTLPSPETQEPVWRRWFGRIMD